MKLLTRTLSLLLITSLTLFFANCGGDGGNEKSAEEVQLGKLKGTWVLGTAKLNGNNATQIDPDFALTISGTFSSGSPKGPYSFSVTGTQDQSPWPATGKWFFGSDPKTQLVRDENGNNTLDAVGDLAMTYSMASDGDLTIWFNCPTGGCGYAGAKTKLVEGDWEFVLTPQ